MSGVGLTEPRGAEVAALPAPERGTAPERTCVGCGLKAPQTELVRFAARDGALVPGRGVPGRGAYTCARLACFERAVSRRSFSRVLRQSVRIDAALSEQFAHRLQSSTDG